MIVYEYECPKCGRFELERNISDEPLKICPKCGKEVRRVYSSFGIQYNCKGFYNTDSKEK